MHPGEQTERGDKLLLVSPSFSSSQWDFYLHYSPIVLLSAELLFLFLAHVSLSRASCLFFVATLLIENYRAIL